MPGSDPGDRGSIPRDPPSFLLFVFSGLVGPCINGTFMGLSIGHFFYGRIADFESRNVGSIRTGTLPCSSLLWCNGSHMALRRSESKFNSWLELWQLLHFNISVAGAMAAHLVASQEPGVRFSRDARYYSCTGACTSTSSSTSTSTILDYYLSHRHHLWGGSVTVARQVPYL